MARIPPDAFDYYLGLGVQRTYVAVGKHFHVSARAVTKRAAKQRWQERLAAIEQKARERADEQAADNLQVVNTRHLKILRTIQSKALQGLQTMPLDSGMDCVRALDLAIKQERLVLMPDNQPASESARDLAAKLREAMRVAEESVPRGPEDDVTSA